MTSKLEQAIQAIQTGQLTTGQSLLAQAIRENPNDETAWIWMATILQEPDKKRECLQKALQLNPENEQAWRDLATLESESGSLEVELEPEPAEIPEIEPAAEAESDDVWSGFTPESQETSTSSEFAWLPGDGGQAPETEKDEEFDSFWKQLNEQPEEETVLEETFPQERLEYGSFDLSDTYPENEEEQDEWSQEEYDDQLEQVSNQDEYIQTISRGEASSIAASWESDPQIETPAMSQPLPKFTGRARPKPKKAKMSSNETAILVILGVLVAILVIAALAYIGFTLLPGLGF